MNGFPPRCETSSRQLGRELWKHLLLSLLPFPPPDHPDRGGYNTGKTKWVIPGCYHCLLLSRTWKYFFARSALALVGGETRRHKHSGVFSLWGVTVVGSTPSEWFWLTRHFQPRTVPPAAWGSGGHNRENFTASFEVSQILAHRERESSLLVYFRAATHASQ